MSKSKLQLFSPLFLKYQSDFEKNPRSRVFAPLAETYRKLGMTDKAMEILSQGIRFHPSYVMGYLGLAFCYFDLKQFNLAYTTLRPLIESNRDNLRMQKLFSEVCLELGKQEEALETLKYLLFINPRDKDVAEQVTRLEREIEERYRPNHAPIIIPERELTSEKGHEGALFNVDKLETKQASGGNDFDDWMAIDLSHEKEPRTSDVKTMAPSSIQIQNHDQWNMKKSTDVHEQKIGPPVKEAHFEDHLEDNRTYQVHLDLEDDSEVEPEEKLVEIEKIHRHEEKIPQEEDIAPLVTHTLVDLYCGQGHIEKALEVLEKILLLNPNDQKTIKKIKEIRELARPLEQFEEKHEQIEVRPEEPVEVKPLHRVEEVPLELEGDTEEEGRRHLMSLIDEKIGPIEIEEEKPQSLEKPHEKSPEKDLRLIEEKLSIFLKKIQKRALDYQGRI
ncbi:MAG: tetratricopeptide repeat protein [Bacteriovorax sp.]